MKAKGKNEAKCDLLMMAIVQAQDAEISEDALCDKGFSVTRLPSVGGFLGRRNVTLMVGLKKERYEEAIEILKHTCRERTEYIAVPLESAPLPLPTPTPVTVGGATIFTFELEHYEEV